jgi:hypothetical protein
MTDVSKSGQAGVEVTSEMLRSAAFVLREAIGDGLLDHTSLQECERIVLTILQEVGCVAAGAERSG